MGFGCEGLGLGLRNLFSTWPGDSDTESNLLPIRTPIRSLQHLGFRVSA